jgi:hypothetical protein
MKPYKIAIVWRGDRVARAAATPQNNRYHGIFAQLQALGIEAEPAVYDEDIEDELRAQLTNVDGVLVWVNPLENGRTRERLDALLRDVAATGPWISAHPDVVLKMGVKEVLHRTRHLGWGSDTRLYGTKEEFRDLFPGVVRANGPRVLKQNRGNAGQGVWKVEWVEQPAGTAPIVAVLEARRGSMPETLALDTFMARCETYFGWGGCIIDQPFQQRLPDGMIRCYMSGDKVAGFGQQKIKALIAPPPEGPDAPAAQSGPRMMHGPDAAPFRRLRNAMETEWTPQMMQVLEIDAMALPIIWDADFLYGPRTSAGEDSYVLCEINVSCVFAIPNEAPAAIARRTLERLREHCSASAPGPRGTGTAG